MLYIPPTKLGLWSHKQNMLTITQTVIKGYDGSIVKAYGDYRDDLI